MLKSNTAKVTLTLIDENNVPVSDFKILNMFDNTGNPVKTNTSGIAEGTVSATSKTWSPAFPDYIDIAAYNFTQLGNVLAGNSYSLSVKMSYSNYAMITFTRNIVMSPKIKTIDYSLVGGGGGGGSYNGGGGGAGGSVNFYDQAISPDTQYQVSIGSGGSGGENVGTTSSYSSSMNGKNGGTTTFMGKTISGGTGGGGWGAAIPDRGNNRGDRASSGPGGGKGGASYTYYSNGTTDYASSRGEDGSVQYMASFTSMTSYGPGGGGGGCNPQYISGSDVFFGYAGNLGGGAGGGTRGQYGEGAGYPGSNGGGGGASCSLSSAGVQGAHSSAGGRGGNGLVAIRMHH